MAICPHALAQTSPNAKGIARLHTLSDEERWAMMKRGAEVRMQIVDNWPLEWRLLVHEYGFTTVNKQRERTKDAKKAFIALSIRHLDLDL